MLFPSTELEGANDGASSSSELSVGNKEKDVRGEIQTPKDVNGGSCLTDDLKKACPQALGHP